MLGIIINELTKPSVTLNENIVASLGGSCILSVTTGKIFFLTKQRNAWRATKINRFDAKSFFFLTRKKAEEAAELQRRNGTQFIIKEVPALVFNLEMEHVFVIHINTDYPLKYYSKKPAIKRLFDKVQSQLPSNEFDFKGKLILNIIKSFMKYSGNWINEVPAKEYVISIFEHGHAPQFSRIHKNIPLKNYKSHSKSGQDSLIWEEIDSAVNPDFIFSLSENCGEQQKNNIINFPPLIRQSR
jgi:hypothetical protein